LRTVELAQSPTGIPAEGAITLLRNDPLTQGPRIFTRMCSTCHRWNGHDGSEGQVMAMDEKNPGAPPKPVPAMAPDLANFGSREWIRSLLSDYPKHMEAVANATINADLAKALLEGSMAGWSKANSPLLLQDANKQSFDDLIEFLYTQSERKDALPASDERVQRGREIFTTGKLAAGQFQIEGADAACTDCHSMVLAHEKEPLNPEVLSSDLQPVLSRYGSQAWIRDMLMNPDAHYGPTNAMPAFSGQLSEQEQTMLTRWMTGEYYKAPASSQTAETPASPPAAE
jgi:ubiquinol-cytochrome c reductase cytochrome b subunit